jgi:septal ring factor EnvC (AmiA/AmiB activator)
MFVETKEELLDTKDTLMKTQEDLEETSDKLKTTTTNLYRTRKDRDEQKHLVSQHIKSETKLHEQASQVTSLSLVPL